MDNFFGIMDGLLKNSFVEALTVEVVFFRLLLAVVFGGIVGYTRERYNKPAGFRTHILVCFGAAIISMVQDQLRLNILELARTNLQLSAVVKTDLGRLGAQVVSGIGFLGAGSIMKEKGETIGGMTTAAGIWATGFESKIVKKTVLLNFEVKFLSESDYEKGIIQVYEVFSRKLIRITQVDKYRIEDTAFFTVSVEDKVINISDVIVSLSAIKSVEQVKTT